MAAISTEVQKLLTDVVACCVKEISTLQYAGQRRYVVEGGAMRANADVPARLHRVIPMQRWLKDTSEYQLLVAGQVDTPLPHWFGTPFGGRAVDLPMLLADVAQSVADSQGTETAEGAVQQLADAIRRERVMVRIEARVNGHAALARGQSIAFSNGVNLRSLGDEQIAQEMDQDSSDSGMIHRAHQRLALWVEVEVPLRLEPWAEIPDEPATEQRAKIARVIEALCAFKPAGAQVAFVEIGVAGPILRNVMPRSVEHHPWGNTFYIVEADEVSRLQIFVDDILRDCRPELSLAKRRLYQSSLRPAHADAIVDAVIGVEALLNTENLPEVTMRVAMNYASLFDRSERAVRYARIKALYRARSDIVHGRGAPRGADAGTVAQEATALLRELISRFWKDDALRGGVPKPMKLDVAYWEARYFAE